MVLIIFSLCAISSPVNAFEIPQFCNVVTPGTQVTLSYVYLGVPWVDIGSIYIPDNFPENSSINFPEPLSKDDLGFLKNYFNEYGVLPPGADGKLMILEVRYPDRRTILYKIQPGFSDIEEFLIPTTRTFGVPPDDTIDLYYPVFDSGIPNQDGGISLLPQSRSLTQYASAGGSQKSTDEFRENSKSIGKFSSQTNKYSGTLLQTAVKGALK